MPRKSKAVDVNGKDTKRWRYRKGKAYTDPDTGKLKFKTTALRTESNNRATKLWRAVGAFRMLENLFRNCSEIDERSIEFHVAQLDRMQVVLKAAIDVEYEKIKAKIKADNPAMYRFDMKRNRVKQTVFALHADKEE